MGKLEVTKSLIKAGGKVNFHGASGDSPLAAAARGGHLRTVKTLVEEGADTAWRDASMQTAATIARLNHHPAVQGYLQEHKTGALGMAVRVASASEFWLWMGLGSLMAITYVACYAWS